MTNKDFLQRRLIELRLFYSAYDQALKRNVSTIFKITTLYDSFGNLKTVVRFVCSGYLYLPDFDDTSLKVISFCIERLSSTQFNKYLEDCKKYGITE